MNLAFEIRKFALHNAVKYDGKANPGSVISKILGLGPTLKAKMKEVSKEVAAIVKEVNAMKPAAQLAELQQLAPEMLEDKQVEEKPRELPELPHAHMGKVVTRMPPEPSKYPHLGHAMAFLVSYLFAKKYQGKCLLRFEDTNPEKSTADFLQAIRDDLAWLGIKPDGETIMSNEMKLFYHAGETLIKTGYAYACFCNQDIMRDLRFKGVGCAHRETPVADNLKIWNDMINKKCKEGEVIIRFKGDMSSKNGVLRDPVLYRIDVHTHYLQGDKYAIWPLYDMASVVMEEHTGVTHVMRSAEFVLRAALHDQLRKCLGYRDLTIFEFGRFNVIGATTKGREIREIVETSKMGWDDPRLVTLRALRRRGITPEAIRELVMEVGLKRDQANIDFTMIASINRKLIDPQTKRYFFVQDPIKIQITKAPTREVSLHLHPEHADWGNRKFVTHDTFFISKKDHDALLKGKLYRLMECLNFMMTAKGFEFDSQDVDAYRKHGESIMHWLPAEHAHDLVETEVVMPDATIVKGYAEHDVKSLKVNDVIQFERFGFCRLDKIDGDKRYFWYTHK